MHRRTFLKLAGIGSLSVAVGCTSDPDKKLYSLVHAPDDMVTGKATWYASTCRECPAGCGVVAKNREGRVIKLEGNPLHPINQGKLCMRGQAALQGFYNPDRLQKPLRKNEDGEWRAVPYREAIAVFREKLTDAAGGRARMMTEVVGTTTEQIMGELMAYVDSPPPLMFEPYAYEALKTANRITFGIDGLCSYHMEEADFLLCFGADFLETWLSPVEYARKFKQMHTVREGRKNLFVHVSPWQSVTAANADQWLPAAPGGETAVLLGCIREALGARNGGELPGGIGPALHDLSEAYTPERVAELSGLSIDAYRKMVRLLLNAKRPLVLGQGVGSAGDDALATNVAANLLNMILDPELKRFDFVHRHRVEAAARRSEVYDFFNGLKDSDASLLLLNNVNPLYALPPASAAAGVMAEKDLFVISFSSFMDETSAQADLIIPVLMPLERWGEYGGKTGLVSTLQPTTGRLFDAPELAQLLKVMTLPPENLPEKLPRIQSMVQNRLTEAGQIQGKQEWLRTVQHGGIFAADAKPAETAEEEKGSSISPSKDAETSLRNVFRNAGNRTAKNAGPVFIAAPSLRFFDGRGANRPWLCEYPDPLTKVAWQTPVLMHPDTLAENGIRQGDIVRVASEWGAVRAPAYAFYGMAPDVAVISAGQGHDGFGQYAGGKGANPFIILPYEPEPVSGAPSFLLSPVRVEKTRKQLPLAHTDGNKTQHGRKIALTVGLEELRQHDAHGHHEKHGFGMHEFPFTLPLPEGYDPHRDLYPPREYDYRWGMVVDLDRCVGCGACSVACYAENNLGIVGEERILEGREMSWLRIERYHKEDQMEKVTFFPMLCQHCDNAPCESVCPVYAPHHSPEGLNNQIYNRCIGTRYCSQNCPYKVRRFNWFTWQWPSPLNLQLNPDVTVRSKGVMEKCSFCVQRIKTAHDSAKNEKRRIYDGEIQPACVQTCPTDALTFGNLADKNSRVRRMTDDPRAYQVMGYLNTKTAVIYLKKVVQEV